MTAPRRPPGPNLLIDFGPLLIFFVMNWVKGIYWATGSLMVTMPLAMAWSWHTRKHIPKMLWFSGLLVLIFGGLTLYLQDEQFIKIKPTVIFTLLGLTLLVGFFLKKPFIKFLFENAFPGMEERGWMLLTRNWGLFFIFKAGLNEYIWRTFSTDTWVAFKSFGFVALTFFFMITQYPVLKKYGNMRFD